MPVEFFADPFTPLLAHLPDSTRIANVSTLQGNLRNDRAGRDGQRMILEQQMYPKPKGGQTCPSTSRYQAHLYRGLPDVPLQETALIHHRTNPSFRIPLYSSGKERRVTVQGHGASWRRPGVDRPRKAVAWLLLLLHLLWAGRPQCPQPGSGEITGTSPHSDHIGRLHTSLKLCVFAFTWPYLCVSASSELRSSLPARELSCIKPRSVCLAEMSLGLLGLPHIVLHLGCQLLSGMLTLGGVP